MAFKLSYRSRRVLRSPLSLSSYKSLYGIFRACRKPLDAISRYALGRGRYPVEVEVRTPIGVQALRLYHPADMLTLNEVFCRGDYGADEALGTVVDFGSNIGVSAAYFLSRNTTAHVHLFEPDQRNIAKLHAQLAPFKGRYTLREVAVGLSDDAVSFCHEETGRYGGVSSALTQSWAATARTTTVPCVDAEKALRSIIARHGEIDVLKVDIEGLEAKVLKHLSAKTRASIRSIYAEMDGRGTELSGFRRSQRGSIAVYRRIAHVAAAAERATA